MEDGIGVKQFTLPRSSPHFCPPRAPTSGGGRRRALLGAPRLGRLAATTAAQVGITTETRASPRMLGGGGADECTLYITVSGYEEGDFKLAVYNFSVAHTGAAGDGGGVGGGLSSGSWSCSEGCDERTLGNTRCDLACNNSACLWDQGDCGYVGEFKTSTICATGCATDWQGDGYCDEACFNAACEWDQGDCISADAGCSDGCLPSWIDDEECDELCNNEACGWDGSDCYHGVDDCYVDGNGTGYRGNIAVTKSGKQCQPWSSQQPHAHMFTHLAYPHAGLGGHNYCRNPGGVRSGPWCHTVDPMTPLELCEVPPAQASCARLSAEGGAETDATRRYHTMCPFDCGPVLGNGQCEQRCNISSCAYDKGDCEVGIDLLTILADQGYVIPGGGRGLVSTYVLVGIGVLVGILIGLFVLRLTLLKLKREELKRRGYTVEEMRGVDNVDPDEIEISGG